MERTKSSLSIARALVQGKKTSAPVPLTTKITKIRIPLRNDLVLDGMSADDAAGSINAEWIDVVPHPDKSVAAERVILYIHGGAYILASRRTHRSITWRLAKYAFARVLSVDYRLAPEATFPIPLYDVINAYRYLIDPPADSGLPKYHPEQISFCGDSAGGGLATSLMLYCRDTGNLPMPGAVGCFSPWYDLTQSFPAWLVNEPYDYLPDGTTDPKYMSEDRSQMYVKHNDDMLNPLASPSLAVEDPSKPIPPMLIQVGDAERVRDDGIVFSQNSFPTSRIRLEVYEDQLHVFQMFAILEPFSRFALKRMGQFLFEQTGASQIRRPDVPHEALRVSTAPGYPIEEIPDAIGIIDDGARLLVERGVWTRSMNDTSLFVVHKKGRIERRPTVLNMHEADLDEIVKQADAELRASGLVTETLPVEHDEDGNVVGTSDVDEAPIATLSLHGTHTLM
ncbi:Alpha/Beta hydrolase protein [Entophlyctis helioformis]|nr:Alpha/Beta hydrolase protein [Entophlyctis helioformis]